ncbi:ATP synthase F(0) complex subunit k, mitochondrial [Lasioglossum baleicum]|uniref:ATP synthase F(0) complex subunit k, mitochondrial n=1 Tax=Lasioglossum baleicum TaxID=434251 RepID=UPI003FCC9CE9
MAGDSEPKLTGLSKYFNSITDTGRANTAKATYAGIALLTIYLILKPRKHGSLTK